MSKPAFSRRDVERSFPAQVASRGAEYAREGRVKHVYRSSVANGYEARVNGTAADPYEVNVDILPGQAGPRFYGRCTCPMKVNCKHVAAVLLAVADGKPVLPPLEDLTPTPPVAPAWTFKTTSLEPEEDSLGPARLRAQRPGKSVPKPMLPAGWIGWLNDAAHQAARQQPVDPPDPSAEHMCYAIATLPQNQRPGVRVRLCTVKPRRNGTLGAPRPFAMTRQILLAPPPFVGGEDLDLMRALLVEGSTTPFESDHVLRGERAPALLQRLLATGRCYAGDAKGKPLALGAAREAQPVWTHDVDGSQHVVWQTDPTIQATLPLMPPWYLDTERHECGPLETGLDPLAAYLASTLPPVDADDVAKIRDAIDARLPTLRIPLPVIPRETDAEDVEPVPCLRLATVELRLGYGIMTPALSVAMLRFDYAGSRVGPGDPGIVRQFADGVLRRIRRDAKREKALHETLRRTGMRRLAERRPPVRGEFEHDYTFEHEDQWVEFAFDRLPELRAAGWVVEFDEGFLYRPAEAGEWHAQIEESPLGWFDLSLGIDIEGQRVDMLPILVALLRAQPGLMRSQSPGDNAPKHTAVRLEDGRILSVPLERLRPMVAVLDELLDGTPKERVRLQRGDALRLAALNASGQLRWDGGEDIRALGERLSRFAEVPPVAPPAGLRATLRPYQLQGLAWLQFLREYGFGGVLADDMGLGKTVQAIAHVLIEKEAGRLDLPALIVAPTSVVPNWRNELARFAPSLRVHVSHGLKRRDALATLAEYDLVITSYPLLARDRQALLEQPFHLVILDEAQLIKNAQTQAANVVRALHSRFRLCMTGTPLENNLGELWSLFHFLMPGFLGDATAFRRLYRTPIEKHDDNLRRSSLERRVRPFLLRRTKEVVASELPKKTEVVTPVEINGAQRELYETVRAAMDDRVRREIAQRGLAQSQIVVLDALLKLRQVCCDPRLLKLDAARGVRESAKFDALFDMLESLLSEGRRVLLFSQFTEMLALIEAELQQRNIRSVKLTGDTRDRETPVRAFQEGKVALFLISLKAGGTGLNLTAADTVIHYDPWWNPAVERQATDRAHRIGQDKPVFVYKLIVAGSVEEKIAEMQSRKAALAEAILGDASKRSAPLTPEDIAGLFEPLES